MKSSSYDPDKFKRRILWLRTAEMWSRIGAESVDPAIDIPGIPL